MQVSWGLGGARIWIRSTPERLQLRTKGTVAATFENGWRYGL